MLHHPEYRERYAANLKRELPRIPFVKADPSTPAEAASARDDMEENGSTGRAGLRAGVQVASQVLSSLPKASAQPARAKRLKETADPSTRAEALGRDDKGEGIAGRGPEGPLYPDNGPRDDNAVFWAFVEAGRRLADIHVNYEQQPEYPLEHVEKGQLNWCVEKMRLGKDKTTLVYNEFLTLRGVPPETYEYRLGNRSALEWVIDQYQVSTDKRSGITNDPNRADDPEYIVRLIGQVITVSLETMKIIKALPELATVGS